MIADSGFVVGLLNRRDRSHARIAAVARSLTVRPWLPSPAITEICYVLHRDVGAAGVATFLARLADGSAGLAVLDPDPEDYRRASETMETYADTGLDFVDAIIVAVAERLNVVTLLTLDHRHFAVIRPRHTAAFVLLPA